MDNNLPAPAHFIVGLDGSRLAESVLPAVRDLAKALQARVTLVHVLETQPPATVHGEPHLTSAAAAQTYLQRVSQRLADEGVDVSTHVHDDPQRDVAAGIVLHAAELNADLIAICVHGRGGGLQDWLVGRTAQRVIALANRPVLVVPLHAKGDLGNYRHLLFPVDQYGDAQAALPLARRLAEATRAEVFLVTVVPTAGTMPGDAGAASVFLPHTAESLLAFAEDEARAVLERLAGESAAAGTQVVVDVRRGDPARELLQAIIAFAADLVVMSTHARTGLDGFWAGSVGPRVVGSAPCPLLLVPIRE